MATGEQIAAKLANNLIQALVDLASTESDLDDARVEIAGLRSQLAVYQAREEPGDGSREEE